MRTLLAVLVLALANCAPSSTPLTPPPVVEPPAAPPAEVVRDDRAVVVGINPYPGAELRGCVNDALAVQSYLISTHGFKQEQVRMLLDRQAKRAALWDALKWLVSDAKPGDRRFFSFSGHGTEYAGDHSSQPGGMNQVVCPYDFDWSRDRMILDTEFAELFGKLPDGVIFCWISDSCHSGDLTRGLSPNPDVRNRQYPKDPPARIKRNLARARKAGWKPRGFHNGILDVGYVSGCRYDQTSADTVEDGKPCGAMTYWLLFVLREKPEAPLKEVVERLNVILRGRHYEQEPQCEGARRNDPFLK